MAKKNLETDGKNQEEQKMESPKPQGSETHRDKKKGFAFGLLAFLTALLIFVAVIGGAFYVVIHNNVSGLADRYRNDIQRIPLLKLALPAVPDPEDPKYLSDEEIRKKYTEIKNKKDELAKQLDDMNKKTEELSKFKDEEDKVKAEAEKMKAEAEELKTQQEQQKKQLEEDRKKFVELVAAKDGKGFKEFYEKLDKDNAKKIYSDILKQQKVSEEVKKFAQIYETMDASAAAEIFEDLGESKIDLIVETLHNMKKEAAAEILAAMDASFASKVTDKLSVLYKSDDTQKD